MGLCATKADDFQETVASTDMGSKRASSKVKEENLAINLDRIKANASNAVVSHARYHSWLKSKRKLADDYEIFPRQVLGEGCNGLVVLAKGRHDHRKYALKTIRKGKLMKALKELTDEVEIYLSLDHPHIAVLRDVYETEQDISLLTECCEGGELYGRLSSAGTYAEASAAEATHQMLLAVGYLHAHRVVHRDLKLENFLYESKKEDAPLKLIDFGFAKLWDPSRQMMASCGSIAYVSPDVLAGKGYTSQCDLWSLGVIVFMLLSGYPPFHGNEQKMKSAISAGKVDWSHRSRWKSVSKDAIDFVEKLLVKDPLQRLDVQGALQHRWLAKLEGNRANVNPLDIETLRNLRRYMEASRVKRAVLQLLALELEPDETKELKDIFMSLDTSTKGTVNFLELKEAIRQSRNPAEMSPGAPGTSGALSPRTPASRLKRSNTASLQELFEVLDANGDEEIYYSDFLAATMSTRGALREEAVRSAFHRLDADDSGTIGANDLKRVLGDVFEGVNTELLVQEATKDGRGEVSYADFLRLLQESDATPSRKSRTKVLPMSPEELLRNIEEG